MIRYVAIGCVLALICWYFAKRRQKTMADEKTFHDRVDAILAAAKGQTSVVASVATVISGSLAEVTRLTAKLAESGADTAELDEALSVLKSNTGALSTAAAINTDASDEVHTDEGGTGTTDGGTVVEPVAAPIEGVTDAAAGGGTAEG